MKIENDSPRLITINVVGHKPLNLKPGTNEVDDAHWDACVAAHGHEATKDKPAGFVRVLLDSRDLLVGKEAAKAAKATAAAQEKLEEKSGGVPGNAGDAIAKVKATSSADQLEEWADTETRKTVLEAIDNRIVELASIGNE